MIFLPSLHYEMIWIVVKIKHSLFLLRLSICSRWLASSGMALESIRLLPKPPVRSALDPLRWLLVLFNLILNPPNPNSATLIGKLSCSSPASTQVALGFSGGGHCSLTGDRALVMLRNPLRCLLPVIHFATYFPLILFLYYVFSISYPCVSPHVLS